MRRDLPKGTVTVIVLCSLLWIAGFFVTGLPDAEKAVLFGAYYKPMILAGEWHRLLTAGFVHFTFVHLFMNMSALWSLGEVLERRFGTLKFLLILFGGVLTGDLMCFALSGNIIAAGLSGGLYGLLGIYTILLVRAGAWRDPRVRKSMIVTFGINLIINFLPGISWMGHLGGFLGGVLIWLAMDHHMHAWIRTVIPACSCILLCVLCMRNAFILENERYLQSDHRILQKEEQFLPQGYVRAMARRLDTIYEDGGLLEEALFR